MKIFQPRVATLFALCLFLLACKKEESNATNPALCQALSTGSFDEAKPSINQYLATQNQQLTDQQKLEALQKWLQAQSCIASATILCTSCIYTLPVQSEVKIRFLVNGQPTEQILDIVMSQPLRMGGIHE